MNYNVIIAKMSSFLHTATEIFVQLLNKTLPKSNNQWWQNCVLDNLTYNQRMNVKNKNISSIEQLDLSSLIRITNKNWFYIIESSYMPNHYREILKDLLSVRNNWTHASSVISGKDSILIDLNILIRFFQAYSNDDKILNEIDNVIEEVETNTFEIREQIIDNEIYNSEINSNKNKEIEEKALVYLVSDPTECGLVVSVEKTENIKRYQVFINGEIRTFYEGQIALKEQNESKNIIDIKLLQSYLTSYQINNPSINQLYSLNAARIDFIPYQFRPALKILQSDEPKILIADSVGVGKTIEAGIIVKELSARNDIENILIICPKPLVAERKWQLEMQRFDEEFQHIDGPLLRSIISDIDRDGEWPNRYSKSIIPYSILNKDIIEGQNAKGKKRILGFNELYTKPHFDLVIVDEAHHIRNSTTQAYMAVKYFCECADAVVFLTATPLQTGDNDLFTLLNILRPDIVIDKASFNMMTKPNKFISKAVSILRSANENWVEEVKDQLDEIYTTQWGENVISKNPIFLKTLDLLNKGSITREERVQMISDIESLHSFHTMINRTRRKDIQDFCVRRSETIETKFTDKQKILHDSLLKFESISLTELHNARSVPFMISTIRRQAASCIFGLAPFMRKLLSRRFEQIFDDAEFELDDVDLSGFYSHSLSQIANDIIDLAEDLPEEDSKFDAMADLIKTKQSYENNKIIIFSTFRNTLAYLKRKLEFLGYRVAQIDGSVKDEFRQELKIRFELEKNNVEALDILLFTEVGCEGLDYQFCNMMINYDLPWNPMKIEQRIGRIDRRGQESDVVNIYNMITADTVDADIYYRCLWRIGVFEDSIGECDEILGNITKELEKIMYNPNLTDKDKSYKLEQMADNEVRKMNELKKLENEEKQLFGVDITPYTTAQKIQDAENPWIAPAFLLQMVNHYLEDKFKRNNFIFGKSDEKMLRLGKEYRLNLLDDYKEMHLKRTPVNTEWERYLKGTSQSIDITFDSNTAQKNRKSLFITPIHPLVKQAAKHFAIKDLAFINLKYSSDTLATGKYYFSIYVWEYKGLNPQCKIVSVVDNIDMQEDIVNILLEATTGSDEIICDNSVWTNLEDRNFELLSKEIENHKQSIKNIINYRLENMTNNFLSQKRTLQQQIADAQNDRIKTMKKSELDTAIEQFEYKKTRVKQEEVKTDIHSKLLVNGILEIRR